MEVAAISPSNLGEYETVVSDIEEYMRNIYLQLKDHLLNDEYGFIVGDDTSARTPTLVIKGFSDVLGQAKGREQLPTLFLQASRHVPDAIVKRQFEDRILPAFQFQRGKKALLVSDHVTTGNTVTRLLKLFKESGIEVDICVMQIQRTKEGQIPFDAGNSLVFEGKPDTQYATRTGFLGSELPTTQIYNQPKISGVEKPSRGGDPFKPTAHFDKKAHETVNAARRDVGRMVNKIISSNNSDFL